MCQSSFNVWICPSLHFLFFLSLLMSFILSNTLGAILFFFFFSSVSNKSRSGAPLWGAALLALMNLICLVYVFFVRLSLSLRLSSTSLSIFSSFPQWQKKVLALGLFSPLIDLFLSNMWTYMRWLCAVGSVRSPSLISFCLFISFPPALTALYDWIRADRTWAQRNHKHLLNYQPVDQSKA